MKFTIIGPVTINRESVRMLAHSKEKGTVTILFPNKLLAPSVSEVIDIPEDQFKFYSIYPATTDQKDTALKKLMYVNPMTTSIEEVTSVKAGVAESLIQGAEKLPSSSKEALEMVKALKTQCSKIEQDAYSRLSPNTKSILKG